MKLLGIAAACSLLLLTSPADAGKRRARVKRVVQAEVAANPAHEDAKRLKEAMPWDAQALAQDRDPFAQTPTGGKVDPPGVAAVVRGKAYALEELKLVAVVESGAQPRAMFTTPRGFGLIVKVGEYLSQAHARVVKILDSRVIVEMVDPAAETLQVHEHAILLPAPPPITFVQEE